MPQLDFKHQFNYRPLLVEANGRKALTMPLPVIEVTLSYNGFTTTDLALIDSGSTFSLFTREIADELGIEILQGRPQNLTTLGGSFSAFAHIMEIQILPNQRYQTEILFAEYPIPRNLLGHSGFFDHVAVALRSKLGLIYLNSEI